MQLVDVEPGVGGADEPGNPSAPEDVGLKQQDQRQRQEPQHQLAPGVRPGTPPWEAGRRAPDDGGRPVEPGPGQPGKYRHRES